MGIAAGIATLAGAWAAWRTASIEPGIALRPAVLKTVRVSGLLALGKMFPLSIRQALCNIIRMPLRSLATIVGVGLGSVIMLLALGMGVTINDNVDTYVNTPQYDLSIWHHSLAYIPMIISNFRPRYCQYPMVSS